jgi:hypothetical protein
LKFIINNLQKINYIYIRWYKFWRKTW